MLINEIIVEGRKKKKKTSRARSSKKSRTPRIYGAWWGGSTGDGGDSGGDGGGGIEETRTSKFLEASGYIPSERERHDPRFSSALTQDITPNSIRQNAEKLALGKIRRDGRPPQARTSGKF